jgi:integrase
MSVLKIGSITIIVNGYTTNNGLPYFQKAVPGSLRKRFGKASIKIPLKEENGHFAIQCQRLTQHYKNLFSAMKGNDKLSSPELKKQATALLAEFGYEPEDGTRTIDRPAYLDLSDTFDPTPHISWLEEKLLPNGTEEASPLLQTAFRLLNNRMPVLLSEAFSVYLNNHNKGQDKKFKASQLQHWNKLVNKLGDIGIESVTREMARSFRDSRLSAGLSSASVLRELNTIRAVFNKAIREIPLNMRNPFESLQISHTNKFENKRTPFTRDEILTLIQSAIKQDDEKRRIAITLALTGARLAEIVGLRKQDFDMQNQAITITPHATRSIKTNKSRVVPLLPIAFEAIQKQYEASQSDYLFPTYANSSSTNSGSASAALNKWSKKIVPKKSMHCFRHSFRDQMREVMCPESISKEIGGWASSHDVSVEYGQGHSLVLKRQWLSKAYEWIEGK